MKRLLSTLILALICAATCLAAGRQAVNDTIVKVIRPDSIVVTETDSTTRVQVYGRAGEPAYHFSYAKGYTDSTTTTLGEHALSDWDFSLPFGKLKSRRTTRFAVEGMAHIHTGLLIPIDKTGMADSHVGWQAGFDIINLTANLPSKRDALSIGFGVEVYLFKQRNGQQWIRRNGQLTTMPFADGLSHRRSLLTMGSFTLPIHYTHHFSKVNALTLSAIPEWNTINTISNRYRQGDKRISDLYRGRFNRRPFDVAVRVAFINDDWGGIYVQYNPSSSFTGDAPTDFKMLTVGFTF